MHRKSRKEGREEAGGAARKGGRGRAESEESSKEGLARKAGPWGVRMEAM